MNQNFLNMLTGLSSNSKQKVLNYILSKFREKTAADSKFYEDQSKIKELTGKLSQEINIEDPYLATLLKLESVSAYSIFKYILDGEYSDILICHDRIKVSNNREGETFRIPDNLYKVYNTFLDHFIENIKFLTSQKLDAANNTLDAEIQGMRFNVTHGSNLVSRRPVIAVRKNLSKNLLKFEDFDYLESIGASEKQKELIKKFAFKGSYIIFGEVGSGKTTLLNYMAGFKLEDKDNLCTIEDTREMNLDVPLSELTSHNASIHDLFVNTLRQYPSHVIIGETRTDDIVDILENALTINVGTTIHAGSFRKAIQRIVFMSFKRKIPSEDILALTDAAIDCFILMEKRKIKGLWIHKDEYNKNIYDSYEEIK